jgi:hypothetical protein
MTVLHNKWKRPPHQSIRIQSAELVTLKLYIKVIRVIACTVVRIVVVTQHGYASARQRTNVRVPLPACRSMTTEKSSPRRRVG